jgi:hypothetical protein
MALFFAAAAERAGRNGTIKSLETFNLTNSLGGCRKP